MGKLSRFFVGVAVGVAGYHYKAELRDFVMKIPDVRLIVERLETSAVDKPVNNESRYKALTQSLKSNGMVIAIDAGHSVKNYGAVSARGYTEFSYNLALVRLLVSELGSRGFKAVIINESGDDISVNERPKLAKAAGANLFVSIHHDSAKEKDLKSWEFEGKSLSYTTANSGYSLFVDATNPNSLKLAKAIGNGFKTNGMNPTHYYKDDFTLADNANGVYDRPSLGVLKHATMPAVLIEAGVIKNKEDEPFLMSEEGRRAIVAAIASGIEKSIKGDK